ncbi:UNVERIFIED_CONTAM: hypothetical protein FKN15_024728 [Acipenser sinensis]
MNKSIVWMTQLPATKINYNSCSVPNDSVVRVFTSLTCFSLRNEPPPGHDTRRCSREEEEEEMQKRRQIQEEHLSKMQSGLGKLILKEEMEKEMTQERYSRSISAQRYDSPQTDSCKSAHSRWTRTCFKNGQGSLYA